LEETKINPALVGDIVIGNVLPRSSQGATEVRIAALLAGFPQEVPVHTCNRQCSSGLQAIATVAASIKAGYYDIGVAGGVEVMSKNPMGWEGDINAEALEHPLASGCYIPMGQTSENVAERYGVNRQKQDQMAVDSHAKAAAAIKNGAFKDEIVPIEIEVDGKKKLVSQDEGVREGTTLASLSKLAPAFKEGGTTTAGNASQVSDGAAISLVARRSTAEALRLPILGVFRSFAVVGVEPAIMGVGPAAAIPEALKKAGISKDDVDVFEINEAFASQAVFCIEKLGIPYEKVNPLGGAIALGHPLGCTGARMTATVLHELKRRKGYVTSPFLLLPCSPYFFLPYSSSPSQRRFGVVSMCIGSGMGAAAVYERE
jgi:acetyl-CoA acyltransferase 1